MARKHSLVGNTIFLRFSFVNFILIFFAIFQGSEVINSRQKRALPVKSQQKSAQTTSNVKMLIKEELRLLQNQICAKDETLCRSGPKGNAGRRGMPGNRGRPGPPGRPGPGGLLVNMDQLDQKDHWISRGILELRVTLVPWGLGVRQAREAQKVSRGSPSRPHLGCSLSQ